jgi:aryl-alcohol dehydrogenase-like predicted oxidoreductase
VALMVWSPLGWGRLTGKIRRGQPPASGRIAAGGSAGGPPDDDEHLFTVVDALDIVARETGKSVAQVALNWLLRRPTVANIVIGARNEEQLKQNLGAVGWSLSAEQVALLDKASHKTPAYPYWHQAGFGYLQPEPAPR